jgi:hypothetical protein
MTELLSYKKVGPKNSNPLLFLQAQGDGDHNPLWSGALEHRVVDELRPVEASA